MSSRSTEKTFDDTFGVNFEEGTEVEVKLAKPMGMTLVDVNEQGGAMIGDMEEGSAARQSNELEIGDFLIDINGEDVRGLTCEEAVNIILLAQGEVKMTFWRNNVE